MTTFQIMRAWLEIHLHVDERGSSLVEYALLVALLAVVCIAAISFVGTSASTNFSNAGANLG
jgi:pilus assembly protein Flp/PilA